MNRRRFFASILGLVCAPVVAKAAPRPCLTVNRMENFTAQVWKDRHPEIIVLSPKAPFIGSSDFPSADEMAVKLARMLPVTWKYPSAEQRQ